MPKSTSLLLPRMVALLEELGENLRLARLRRRLSTVQVAERAGMGRSTLLKIERGHPGVGMGQYLSVLKVYGLEHDVLLLAKDDVFGRKLQDAQLSVPQRAPKRKKTPGISGRQE
ncbi:helix-turn-helix domain-containing protein [bacterium]|nr:helix-turn-helix domain-containing protein [bacterium]